MRIDGKILGASAVPWTADFEFDETAFRGQVNAQLDAGIDHLYIFGTAGEGYAVTDDQFIAVTTAFVDQMRQRNAEPMVGVINLSLGTMMERIEAAQRIGARRFQISMPSWGELSDTEMTAFFGEVLTSFPDAEFLHYNVARAKRQLTGPEYGVLASRHPNLVATKQSTDSMRQIALSMEASPQLRHYFVDGGYAYGSLIGDCGVIPSLGNCNIDRLHQYAAAGTARRVDELLETQRQLWLLVTGLLDLAGRGFIDGAYDKLIWSLNDPTFPLRVLPPYAGFSRETANSFRKWIAENVPSWAQGA